MSRTLWQKETPLSHWKYLRKNMENLTCNSWNMLIILSNFIKSKQTSYSPSQNVEINSPHFLDDVDKEKSTRETASYREISQSQLKNIWHFSLAKSPQSVTNHLLWQQTFYWTYKVVRMKYRTSWSYSHDKVEVGGRRASWRGGVVEVS